MLLVLATSLLLSMILIEPAERITAQISPPIPEFSLKLEDYSYDVAPIYTTDPYNRETVVATPGYRVERKFVAVIINNPDPPSFYAVVNSSVVKLYYRIRIKGHSQDWANATVTQKNLAPNDENTTTIRFGLGSVDPDPGGYSIWIGDIASFDDKVDVQVQGINGYYTNRTNAEPPCWRIDEYVIFHETGRSDWSETQKISIKEVSTPTPTATPRGSGRLSIDSILLILAIITAIILSILLVALIYPKKRSPCSPNFTI